MPNHFFKFKYFTVQQEHCAMKVCTDACLFGALVADNLMPSANCLDIGAGTGLLTLMLAQKDPQLKIDAVELDEAAAKQAGENFESSPWNKRLTIHHTDILAFKPTNKYDYIISNPPFFEGDLLSDDAAKNKAKHHTGLSLEQLLNSIKRLLSPTGVFAILLPYHRVSFFEALAEGHDFYCQKKILVKQTVDHPYFRGILFFSREKHQTESTELSIKNSEGKYTEAFIRLMKDYYLAF